jgi:tetratricopeptide (TPR) repeat protein
MLKFTKSNLILILVSNVSKIFLTYRNYFLVYGAVLILSIASFTFLHHRSAVKETKMFEILAELEKFYLNSIYNSDFNHEATYDETKEKFMAVISKLTTTNKASKVTKIILGNISYNAGAFEDAIALYSDVLPKLDDTTILKNLVVTKLAYCHLANGSLDEAEVCFGQILSGNRSIMKDEALFNIALLHEYNGKLVLAEELYKQFLTCFPDSLYSKIVKRKIE